MSRLVFGVLIYLLSALILNTADGSLHLEVNPTDITPGLTKSLIVNCSFSYDGAPNISGIISLIVSRSVSGSQQDQFVGLRSVNVFTPEVVNELSKVSGTAAGHIKEDGDSYVSIQWPYPTVDQAGLFRCQVKGMDNSGQPTEFSLTSLVASKQADVSELLDKVSDLEDQLNDLSNLSQNQSDAINSLLSLAETQLETISTQQTQINNQSAKITTMESMALLLMNSMAFYISTEYNGHYYLVSKEDWNNSAKAVKTCEDYGGYLALINNDIEYRFVKDFLNQHDGFLDVLISGTDEVTEGEWIVTNGYSELNFTAWGQSEPNTSDLYNCIVMYRGNHWLWYDEHCTNDYTNKKFLCEVEMG